MIRSVPVKLIWAAVESRNKLFAFKWVLPSRWTIVIFDRKINKNMNHSFNRADRLSIVLVWRTILKIMWFVIIVKNPSSKYCDSLVKTQTKTSISSFVAQYRVSASKRDLNKNKIDLSTPSFLIWCKATLYPFSLLPSTYSMNDNAKSKKTRVKALIKAFFNFSQARTHSFVICRSNEASLTNKFFEFGSESRSFNIDSSSLILIAQRNRRLFLIKTLLKPLVLRRSKGFFMKAYYFTKFR